MAAGIEPSVLVLKKGKNPPTSSGKCRIVYWKNIKQSMTMLILKGAVVNEDLD